MNRFLLSLATASFVLSSAATAICAEAQTSSIAGTWRFVSAVVTKDGKKIETFGEKPNGSVIFTNDGHYALVFTQRDLPKVASEKRTSQTADEARAIAQGSVATFGTYKVENKFIVLHIEGGTFPNWTGAEQRRPFTLSKDELTYTSPGTTGSPTENTLRRVK